MAAFSAKRGQSYKLVWTFRKMLQKSSCQDRIDHPSFAMDAGTSLTARSSQHNRPCLCLPFLGGALKGHGSEAFSRSCSRPVPQKQSFVALVSIFGVSSPGREDIRLPGEVCVAEGIAECGQVRAASLMKIVATQFGFGKGKVKAPKAVTRPTIVPQPSYNIPAVLLGALAILACPCAFSPVRRLLVAAVVLKLRKSLLSGRLSPGHDPRYGIDCLSQLVLQGRPHYQCCRATIRRRASLVS